MTRKNLIRAGIAGIAGAAILGAGVLFSTHTYIDGAFFPKDSAQIDLTGHNLTAEEYLEICARYPAAEVLWTVPFQGSRYPVDAESVALTSLTEEEARILDYLPNLKRVDAVGCTDYDALAYLQQRRPDCQVYYEVSLGGSTCSSLDTAFTAVNADGAEWKEALGYLPNLSSLTLEGTLPEAEALLELQSAFPDVRINCSPEIGGRKLSTAERVLDLSGGELSARELAQMLPLYYQAEEVNLTDTGLTDGACRELMAQFPDIFFRCTLDFAGKRVATDASRIDISGMPVTPEDVEAMLPCFPKLEKLVMSDCGIDDETMDALNRRHPQIAIVWTVQVGIHPIRTDATVFFPAGVSESSLPNNEEMKKLRYCTEMIAVDIGHSKATECDWVASMPHLRYLILADTGISDLTPLSNLKELVYLEVFMMENLTDYSPLLGCTALQDLNIGMTYGDPEPISKMTWLHNLQWRRGDENPATRDRVLMLEEQLPDTNVVIQCWRNIGGPWRYLPNYYVFRDIIGGVFFDQYHPAEYWGVQDARRILSCEGNDDRFAGEVLAELVKERMDNGLPIPGVKNIGSEKAEILYEYLLSTQP